MKKELELMAITQEVEALHIKMDNFTITDDKILKDSYIVKLENTYAQAKRTNTLQMVKILIGKVYTVQATLMNITSDELRQIQAIALRPDISAEFFDDNLTGQYVVQSMYCPTIEAKAKKQLANGKILYNDITLELIGNQAAD